MSQEEPCLQQACLHVISKHKNYLRDLGDASLALLGPVLLELGASQLDKVEACTLEGGRDVRQDTWPLWYRHCTEILNSSINLKKELKNAMGSVTVAGINHESPLLPIVVDALSALRKSPVTIRPANYREAYAKLIERKQKVLAEAGKALRVEFKKTEKKKAIMLIEDPIAMAASRRGRQRKGTANTRPPNKPATLARKLGISQPQAPSASTTTTRVNTKLHRESLIRQINKSNQSARYKKSLLPTQKQLSSPPPRAPT